MRNLWMIDEGNPGKGATGPGPGPARPWGGRPVHGQSEVGAGSPAPAVPVEVSAFSARAASLPASTSSGLTAGRMCRAERTLRDSAATLSVDCLRNRRTRLPLLWLIRCDDPHRLCWTLPLAETLNRFFIPLWVFSLGMIDTSCQCSRSFRLRPSHRRERPGLHRLDRASDLG